MITNIADKETAVVWSGRGSRKLPADIQATALRKLLLIHAADTVGDLRIPPGNRLEKLTGDRAGQWSIRINEQWRICFAFTDKTDTEPARAEAVVIVDYH